MSEHILVVDDERNLRESLAEALAQNGYQVTTAAEGRAAYALLQESSYDLMLCDWQMPVMDGAQLLALLKEEGRLNKLPVLVLTAHGTSSNAIEAIQLGAYDFITKPFDLDEILVTVRRSLEYSALQKEVIRLRQQVANPSTNPDDIIGASQPMMEVFKSIGRVAQTDSTVLVVGESGTGKELVAHAIHNHSPRKSQPFVVVNCAALPEPLVESELFGYERGAFTGAVARKQGKFETAEGGTIFLDEIGELPLNVQPKLLRILQEHSFERVGSSESIHTDFRVIAATNRDLEEEVAEGRFRKDLYFRINVVPITLPPLRERRSDILPLAEYFLVKYSQRHSFQVTGLTEEAVLYLQRYSFPGNVRELEHIIERSVLMAGGQAITPEMVREKEPSLPSNTVGQSLEALLDLPYHESVQAWEKLLIDRALASSNGNKALAARKLNIHRRLLYEKLEGIEKDGE